MPRCAPVILALLLPTLSALAAANSDQDTDRLFRESVAPILERSCIGCHHGVAARGKLALDTRAGLLKGGESGPAADVGQGESSLLIQMVSGDSPEMPQDAQPLSAAQVDTLKQWIDRGLPWPDGVVLQDKREGEPWWSLKPLSRPNVPSVTSAELVARVKTPVDAFIFARLEEQGLRPSAEADRATLIRRLAYDLHGVPPTPVEVQAFCADQSPDAYDKLIDRLLASPRYGERWARHWLDVAHFGETHGYDKDKRRDHAWPYRDWVIDAFNADKPYRDFVREQIAGDVVNRDDPTAIIATGFIAAGPWDFVGHVELREDTVEKAKTRAIDRDDMVANAMSSFASLTVHCARCHDHAFDPIPQLDHYRLQAVFAGVDRQDVPFDDPPTALRRRQLASRQQQLRDQLSSLAKEIEAVDSPELQALTAARAKLEANLAELPDMFAEGGQPATSPTNGWHSAISPTPDAVKWVQLDLGQTRSIDRVRLIPARPTDFPDAPGFGFPLRFKVEIGDRTDLSDAAIVFDSLAVDFANPGARPVVLAVGRAGRYLRVTATRLWKRTDDFVFALAELQAEEGDQLASAKAQVSAFDSIEAGRWSNKALIDGFGSRQPLPDLARPEIAAAVQARDDVERQLRELAGKQTALKAASVPRPLVEARASAGNSLRELEAALAALPEPRHVYAIKSHEPRPIHVLERGDVEKPGPLVAPGALSCLPDLPAEFALSDSQDEGARRLALANWLTDDRNALVWRSIVNRVWHYHFGRGIVDTPNDFGRNGGQPSHPQLLDWLAVEFRDSGGSLKRLHQLILRSAAYRQRVARDDAQARLDSGNQYLWRMNRRRLEAEEIRDAVLAVSGKLVDQRGGPSFQLFEFKDDHSPRYDYVAMDKPEVWRRSIYRLITRSVQNPWLETLDCPDPSLSAPVRTTTITALQALATLNDDFVIRQSQYLAERLRAGSSELPRQIEQAYWLCLSRSPAPRELEQVVAYAREYGLPNACRLLFNLNEFIFID